MEESMKTGKTLRVVSLEPKIILIKQEASEDLKERSSSTEEVIIAPFLIDEEKALEDISELVDVVYQKFSEACDKRNLSWEAELEIGMEFGVRFSAKLKIAPLPPS